jgi:hypothetical protein
MINPYLTTDKIKKAFHEVHLEENYNFLQGDLEKLADVFVMAAVPSITAEERERCVTFVRSLNTQVAQALADFKGEV